MVKTPRKPNKDTLITETGRDSRAHFGIVNPPVYHASTVLFETLDDLERITADPFEHVYYGRQGTPTTFAFERAVADLEGGFRAVATASGLAAIGAALKANLKAGDHFLVSDSVYGPTRKIYSMLLGPFGVEATFFDPLIGAGIGELMRDNTRVVFCESPGSLTFEVQDLPAIAEAAHSRGAVVMVDNSWATPLYFEAMTHGADIAIHSGTKYLVGHSDAMIGAIVTSEAQYRRVKAVASILGAVPGPDDCYLALRGIRTLSVRLARHQETAMTLATWLEDRDEVARVLHPAFPGCPGHETWKRDFTGATGLFSIVLDRVYPKAALAAMVDNMRLFKMGYSWGGFESLILPADPGPLRTAVPWQAEGTLIRLHAGLEDADDLLADLEDGLKRLRA